MDSSLLRPSKGSDLMPRDKDERKDARLSLRINPQEKKALEQAAGNRHKTLSSFVVEQAYRAAQQVMAEQTQQ